MDLSDSAKQIITKFIISITSTIDAKIHNHNDSHGSSANFGHTKAGGVPKNVSSIASAGTDNGYYARADHVHKASYNGLSDKPVIPVASSIVPNADTSDGSIGNSVTWAKADNTHPKSSLYAESTHVHNNYMENNQGHSNYVNISDVSSLYLSDEDMPNGIRKDCNHAVNYDKSTGFTQIRVNEGNTSNTGHGYYLTIHLAHHLITSA